MSESVSLTRRLIAAVLLLEVCAAIALVAAITIHERHVQLMTFDVALEGAAKSLMGAVQDAEDENDNVLLDLRGVHLSKDAVFRVEDERGRVLGAAGELPSLSTRSSPSTQEAMVGRRTYRFFTLHGLRITDPGKPNGGIQHKITIVYGRPVGRVWHEVYEATRFFAIATVILLILTAFLMVWLIREGLQPIHELARQAERINSADWHFTAPASAKRTNELRPLSSALESALARLQRSFEQQKRFTSDAAHELKTDAAIVKSSLQLLSMRKRTAEEYSHGLALSLDDFTRLETTIQKMLTLARLEQPAEREGHPCSLREAVEEAIHQSKSYAEMRSIRLLADLKFDPVVPIDSRDALLLCSNILLNALQHSPDGTTVRLEMVPQGTMAKLIVLDRGEGIKEEDLPFLFDPFYRGDPSRSRKSGGTGLGLSICRAICDRLGGTIAIANRTSGGAVVTVMLPVLSRELQSTLSESIKA